MKDDREFKRIISKIRFKKIATAAAFAAVAVFSLLFLGDFHYYNGIEEKGIGLGLHPLIILSVIIIEGIFAVIVYSKTEKSAEKIIEEDCDPYLYLQVRKAFLSRRDVETVLPIIEVRVAYYLGDFVKCEKIASVISQYSGIPDRLYGLSYLALGSFFLDDRKQFDTAIRDFRRLLERSGLKNRSPIRRDMDRRQNVLEMLSLCLKDDAENALMYADSLFPGDDGITNIVRLNLSYLRAVVYEKFGKNKKSQECLDLCRTIPSKTFIAERIKN